MHSTVQTLDWPLQIQPSWGPRSDETRLKHCGEYIFSEFPPRMTTALCKSKLDCLCWLPNCQRQKKLQVAMQASERPQIQWRMLAFTVLPVCHNQSILWVVTRCWIIDSCRQLTAYVTADWWSITHLSALTVLEVKADIHSVCVLKYMGMLKWQRYNLYLSCNI